MIVTIECLMFRWCVVLRPCDGALDEECMQLAAFQRHTNAERYAEQVRNVITCAGVYADRRKRGEAAP